MFGGALRQGGIVAAAGIVGLETMVGRLAEDHENARVLADGLGLPAAETNMVLLDVGGDAKPFLATLRSEGVLAGMISASVVRFVTHKDVSRSDVQRAAEIVAKAR